ncbi:hypothetical protein O6P43_009902 [Quillaja saponaria]|uniref:Uncharacterized protein n=1 Tax=Quillaja saponaria TaxID=32244 RepID=A0AAD7PZ86_QUISA|nr:hypothetical protein O6P43_009902 [Quillaja saponaria]
MRRLNISFPRKRKSVTKEQNMAAMMARVGNLDNETEKRLTLSFAKTWELLLANEFRPPYKNYLIIDQQVFTTKKVEAPMHWSARAVRLGESRTKIEDLWSSELALNDRAD